VGAEYENWQYFQIGAYCRDFDWCSLVLRSRGEWNHQPAQLAKRDCVRVARRDHWESLMAALDTNAAAVLCCLVAEADLTTLVPRLKRSRSALQTDKQRLGRLVLDFLGEDIMAQVQQSPRWMDNVAAHREKLACRVERQTK